MKIVAFYFWDCFYSKCTPLYEKPYWNKYKDESQNELLETNISETEILKLIVNSLINEL